MPIVCLPRTTPRVDRKVKPNRPKSVGRDAMFRPVFRALAALDQEHANGGTSVTWHTHDHPLFRIIHLNASVASQTPLINETLDDSEEIRTARFWRSHSFNTARTYRTPAEWRDLSDEFAVEWFHYGLQSLGPTTSFTLNLSPEIEAKARLKGSDWLFRRVRYHLQNAFGRKPEFWFALELTDTQRLHVHGELQAAPHELAAVRKALRLAGGEWDQVRQHQAHTKPDASIVWANYTVKDAWRIRPFRNITRPINGGWLFASNGVKQAGKAIYDPYRQRVIDFLAGRAEPSASQMPSLTRRSPRTGVDPSPAPDGRHTLRRSGGLLQAFSSVSR